MTLPIVRLIHPRHQSSFVRRVLAASAVLAASIGAADLGTAQALQTMALVDRYLAGDTAGVVAALDEIDNFNDLLKDLEREGPAWIAAAGPDRVARRRLAAATFALEAARAGEWLDWKHRRLVPAYLGYYDKAGRFRIPEVLTWSASPRLLEWGCKILREAGPPGQEERAWQLAALAVAQRSEDAEFQRSDGIENIYNPDAEIDHLFHVRLRFPAEPRFQLGEAILQEWRSPAVARQKLEDLQDDIDLAGEATMRLAAIAFRQRDDDRATSLAEKVERLTRDPWVLYLARYVRAQAYERKKRAADAERSYRAALAAWPGAQSATLSLAALLTAQDRRREAAELVGQMYATTPVMPDPWREYAHADNRFWPLLIGNLRAELGR